MDDVLIITEILKYFNFEELCMAERINRNFKSCVQSELHRLRYVDFGRIFTVSWMSVMDKIQTYCSGLHHLKNFYNVTSFVLDAFTFEHFLNNFLIFLPSLRKLTCLEIKSCFLEKFNGKNVLSFVENSRNLLQLSADISEYRLLDNGLRQRINKVIIGHSALMRLEINYSNDLWINLSLCRNLTHFTLTIYGRMNISKYEQLFSLLDVNLNLESLNITNISLNNLKFIEKLVRLPKLKSLSLYIHDEDSDLPYHRIRNDLYFVSLENIQVECEQFESHAKFVAFLLSRSPRLKELSLEAFYSDLAFFRILFDEFPLYDQIEIFTIYCDLYDELGSFVYNELSKMVNVKYFCLDPHDYDFRKIAELRKLKLLRWSALDAGALKMLRFTPSLEGLDLYDNEHGSPALFDLILNQCPNLRYFSIDFMNSKLMRELALKAPNLQYLPLRDYSCYSATDDLTYVVENLPNLRQLWVCTNLYNLLLGHEPIKRLCRRKRLLVSCDENLPEDNVMLEWLRLCCKETPST